MEKDERRVLLKVSVVEGQSQGNNQILVREGDDPYELAREFCREHALADSLVNPLTAHILQNLNFSEEKQISDRSSSESLSQIQNSGTLSNMRLEDEPGTPKLRPNQGHSPPQELFSQKKKIIDEARTPEKTPRTPEKTRRRSFQRLLQTSPPQRRGNVTEQLYEDAKLRQLRRAEMERQLSTPEPPPSYLCPGSKNYTLHYTGQPVCRRLYDEGQARKQRFATMRLLKAEQNLREEMRQTTFEPSIEESQKVCSALTISPQRVLERSLKREIKKDHFRRERLKREFMECTFRPKIPKRSRELAKARSRSRESLFDDLYRERKKPTNARSESEPKRRFGNEEEFKGFLQRLTYGRKSRIKEVSNEEYSFQPSVGRTPKTLRRRDRESYPSISEFLHNSGRKEVREPKMERWKPSRRSEKILRLAVVRKVRDFVSEFPDECSLEFLEKQQVEFPALIRVLEREKRGVSKTELERLLVKEVSSSSLRRDLFEKKQEEREVSCGNPKILESSKKLAVRHRPRVGPLHEQLIEEKRSWQKKLEKERQKKEALELSFCSFQPRTNSKK